MAESKNAVATQSKQTPMDLAINNQFIDQLSAQLTKKQQYGLSFPPNYSVSNALNSAYLILQETFDKDKKPVLQSCSKQSIAAALIDMTVQGLNPMKKQCYFIAHNGKLTLMRSYQGTMAVAKRCGAKRIVAEVIYEGDIFEYHIENGIKVIDKHVQDFKNIDNSKIIGAYAIVTMEDYTYTEIMHISQIKKAWAKGYGYVEGKGVHTEFTDQMCKKTVINRACKNIINSSDDGYLTEAFENTADEETDIVTETVQQDIQENANTEEFVEPETIEGEVVKTLKQEQSKQDQTQENAKQAQKQQKEEKPLVKSPDIPDWMQQE